MKTIRFILYIIGIGLISISCDDPLSDREHVVRTLINGPLTMGQYSVFWDGTNDKKQAAESGVYIAVLYTRNFTLIDTLTALEGTEKKNNRDEYYFDFPQLMDTMDDNVPDPFYIQDGTNIRFAISEDISARLTIQLP
ncbi:hypothetical protein JW948_09160 [bacterium]|nr:hypothetical protein [bacterium]